MIKIKYFSDDRNWELKKKDIGNGIDLHVDSIRGYYEWNKDKEWYQGLESDDMDIIKRDFTDYEVIKFKRGDVVTFGLGVAMQLPEGYFANVRPRSSIFNNFRAIQVNSVGLIDESYSGDGDEWMVQVLFLEDSAIRRGERMCQFTIEKSMEFDFIEVDSLGNEDRGGYGTTGI